MNSHWASANGQERCLFKELKCYNYPLSRSVLLAPKLQDNSKHETPLLQGPIDREVNRGPLFLQPLKGLHQLLELGSLIDIIDLDKANNPLLIDDKECPLCRSV